MAETEPAAARRAGARTTVILFVATLGVVLALCPGAWAAQCLPDGVSSISQLYPDVPSASCDRPLLVAGNPHGTLPRAAARRLARAGRRGQAIIRLVAGTLPAVPPPAHSPEKPRVPAGMASSLLLARGSGVLGGLLQSLVVGWGEGGVGIWLPIVLAGVLAAALARRRQAGR